MRTAEVVGWRSPVAIRPLAEALRVARGVVKATLTASVAGEPDGSRPGRAGLPTLRVSRARLFDDPLERLVELLALTWVQPAEQMLAQFGGCGVGDGEALPPAFGDGDLEGPTVVRVPGPLGQLLVF